jgi:hypothetical protein
VKWSQQRGTWICGPWTVRVEHCPRRKLTYFELYDACRFVQAFASAQEAMQHAQCVAQRPANDVQRRSA